MSFSQVGYAVFATLSKYVVVKGGSIPYHNVSSRIKRLLLVYSNFFLDMLNNVRVVPLSSAFL